MGILCVVCGAVNWRATWQYNAKTTIATDPTPKNLSLGKIPKEESTKCFRFSVAILFKRNHLSKQENEGLRKFGQAAKRWPMTVVSHIQNLPRGRSLIFPSVPTTTWIIWLLFTPTPTLLLSVHMRDIQFSFAKRGRRKKIHVLTDTSFTTIPRGKCKE